jgi:hypothetical protein
VRTIYKYNIFTLDEQTIDVPILNGCVNFKGQFLKIDAQYEIPCLWCLVDDETEERPVKIRVVGTGRPMPRYLKKEDYLGSYQLDDGLYVFHVFWENG